MGTRLRFIIRQHLTRPHKVLSGHQYNVVVTRHALMMIFFMVMPTLMGGYGNLLVPLQIGAPDLIFPRINLLRYTLLLPALVLLVARMKAEGGRGTSWTFN